MVAQHPSMRPIGEPRADLRGWVGRQAAWLEATRSEVVGLLILLTGAVAVSVVLWWTGTPRDLPESPAVEVASAPTQPLFVHVAGAVHRPGVVRLPPGSRVGDALAAAGGPALDAQVDALNLARELNDGEQLFVPSLDAAGPDGGELAGEGAGGGGGATGGAWRPDGRLDINRATAAELEELPGIGPVLAERIVEHREANGPFGEVGDLRDVSGIGERTLERLADLITH
jgi:competence protein ComEA